MKDAEKEEDVKHSKSLLDEYEPSVYISIIFTDICKVLHFNCVKRTCT